MTYSPPGLCRTLFLLAKAGLRRKTNWLSRGWFAVLGKRRRKAQDQKRTATPRRSQGKAAGLIAFGLIFIFNGLNLSSTFVCQVSDKLDERSIRARGLIPVSKTAYEQILAGPRSTMPRSRADADHHKRLGDVFRRELEHQGVEERDIPAQVEAWSKTFDERGPAAFEMKKERRCYSCLLLNRDYWPLEENEEALALFAGFCLLVLCMSALFVDLGIRNINLGKVEWDLQWLFTLPVSARAIFAGRLVESAFTSPFVWMLVFPFLLVMFWSSGLGWLAILPALGIAIYSALMISSVRLLVETWLKKSLSKNTVKNMQAVFTILGILLFLAIGAVAFRSDVLDYLLDELPRVQSQLVWLPWSVPALLWRPDAPLWLAIFAIAAFGALIPMAGIEASSRLVSDGLMTSAGPYTGTRSVRRRRRRDRNLFTGVVGKDLRFVLRDRNVAVQVTLLPVMLIGFHLFINPVLLTSAITDPRHASALAFAVGAFVLLTGASTTTVVEAKSLWLLFTFPQKLGRMLLSKARLWASVASVFTAIMLIATLVKAPSPDLGMLWGGLLALVGILIYAHVATGLSAYYTDAYETEDQQRLRPEMPLLFMLLAGMYVYAFYAPTLYAKLCTVMFGSFIGYAAWETGAKRLPYSLDASWDPPYEIGMGDGLVAAYLFFTIQGLFTAPFYLRDSPPLPMYFLVIYIFAAFVVTGLTLYSFVRLKVPKLWQAIGLRRSSDRCASAGKAIVSGAVWGVAAAVFGLVYLFAIEFIEPLRELKQQSPELFPQDSREGLLGLAILLVVVAPLFEEYIFRGLVFRGMRRSYRPAVAIVGSAVVFALCHPPISALPVFVLGIAAAVSFEKTGLLIAPITAHIVYNGSLVLARVLGI